MENRSLSPFLKTSALSAAPMECTKCMQGKKKKKSKHNNILFGGTKSLHIALDVFKQFLI